MNNWFETGASPATSARPASKSRWRRQRRVARQPARPVLLIGAFKNEWTLSLGGAQTEQFVAAAAGITTGGGRTRRPYFPLK
jgi:hypothetical protein